MVIHSFNNNIKKKSRDARLCLKKFLLFNTPAYLYPPIKEWESGGKKNILRFFPPLCLEWGGKKTRGKTPGVKNMYV